MRKLSCDMLQGFYFSRPCPLPEAIDMLKKPVDPAEPPI